MGDIDNYYDRFCKARFDGNEKKIDTVDGKVDDLTVIVSNGLSDRVKKIDRMIWVLIGTIIVESIIGRIF